MNTDTYDFLHSLQDTLSLLGGSVELRELVAKLMDNSITPKEVDALGKYSCSLFGLAKHRLAHLHTIKIKPQGAPEF